MTERHAEAEAAVVADEPFRPGSSSSKRAQSRRMESRVQLSEKSHVELAPHSNAKVGGFRGLSRSALLELRGASSQQPAGCEQIESTTLRGHTMTERRQHALVELLIHSTMAPEELSDVQKSADNHDELL